MLKKSMQKLNEISLAHYLPSRCVILKKKEMNMAPFATQKILKFKSSTLIWQWYSMSQFTQVKMHDKTHAEYFFTV